jgi:hypothetical protein
MPKLTGHCLCGNVSFAAESDIHNCYNCHCGDCRRASGAAFQTLVFIDKAALRISGTPKVYTHTADSGSVMEKHFCPDCGAQMFGHNRSYPDRMSIRAGVLDQPELVRPRANLYVTGKIPSTAVDPDLDGYPAMPG